MMRYFIYQTKRISALAVLALLLAASAFAQALPKADSPESVGFSSERLARISDRLQQDVDQGKIPGAVLMIVRHGKVAYFEAFGYQDREKKIPMKRDSLFRIASMTKPVTSVATMMLVEEGKIQLIHPVSRYLPEFKNLKVGIEKTDPATGKKELVLVPAEREMTVQDLLRHTSGITYAFFGKSMVKDLYMKTREGNPFSFDQTNAEMVTKLSKLPLHYQPGTTWDYSMSPAVLGRIIEVVSGMELDAFIAERIAKPLKMTDSAFWAVGPERFARLAEADADPKTGKRPGIDVSKRPRWLGGDVGMVSTASDYARFTQMLLNRGILDGERLLSPKTVELMASNHLPPGTKFPSDALSQHRDSLPSPEMGQGFGLGFTVRTEAGMNPNSGSVGTYYWQGIYGTNFWIDPKEDMTAVFMLMAQSEARNYRSAIRNYVYQALVK
jgi:CubicO group peptidase (beta-lactamase class C family)